MLLIFYFFCATPKQVCNDLSIWKSCAINPFNILLQNCINFVINKKKNTEWERDKQNGLQHIYSLWCPVILCVMLTIQLCQQHSQHEVHNTHIFCSVNYNALLIISVVDCNCVKMNDSLRIFWCFIFTFFFFVASVFLWFN